MTRTVISPSCGSSDEEVMVSPAAMSPLTAATATVVPSGAAGSAVPERMTDGMTKRCARRSMRSSDVSSLGSTVTVIVLLALRPRTDAVAVSSTATAGWPDSGAVTRPVGATTAGLLDVHVTRPLAVGRSMSVEVSRSATPSPSMIACA